MNIVTGYKGTPHVSSNDDQGRNQGIFGTGNYVLNVGDKFAASLTGTNTVTITDGEGIMQGVHFRIEPGTTDSVEIDAGTSGYNRIDLIVARYSKNSETRVESVSLEIVKGTRTTGTATAPSYNTGNILEGGTLVDFPLYRVTLSGTTITLTSLFTVADSVADMTSDISALHSALYATSSVAHYSGTAQLTNVNSSVSATPTTLTNSGIYLLRCNVGFYGTITTTPSIGVYTGSNETIIRTYCPASDYGTGATLTGFVVVSSSTTIRIVFADDASHSSAYDIDWEMDIKKLDALQA